MGKTEWICAAGWLIIGVISTAVVGWVAYLDAGWKGAAFIAGVFVFIVCWIGILIPWAEKHEWDWME